MTVLEVALVCIVLWCIHKYRSQAYGYWKSKGAPYVEPDSYWDSIKNILTREISPAEDVKRVYNAFSDKRYVGFYLFRDHFLYIRDPELIKVITIKDFDHFVDRMVFLNEETDPIFAKSLISIQGQRWRNMRNTLSPAFTSAKIKNMFSFMNACGEQLTQHLDQLISQQSNTEKLLRIELKDLFSRYANDVVAATAFGLQVDSFKEPDNEFYRMGQIVSGFSEGIAMIRLLFIGAFPYLAKKLKISFFGVKPSEFFRTLISQTLREREQKKIVRPDMIHLLMQARDGTLDEQKCKLLDLSDEDIAGQALLFFFAGFDTSSRCISFTAYELAVNTDIQRRLHDEIVEVTAKNGGELTYDSVVHQMKYLDMVISESLRKWPVGVIGDRIVTKKYTIPSAEDSPALTLNPGDNVWIPIFALHYDPKYFQNPDKFDPERFNEENKAGVLNSGAYLPFGSGPRNCIGKRFALMQVKLCLVNLIRKFSIEVVEKSQVPMKLSRTNGFTLAPEKGFWVGLRPRKQ